MAVGPITFNGVIQRAQDVSAIKQQEDAKPMAEQQNIQAQLKTQEERLARQVTHADDASEHEKKYDAKEKGSNEYQEDRRKKKKKSVGADAEKRKAASAVGFTHFDMKI